MDNWDDLRDQITNSMQLKTTEELKSILEENDSEEWSDTAFEVVKEILAKPDHIRIPKYMILPKGHKI